MMNEMVFSGIFDGLCWALSGRHGFFWIPTWGDAPRFCRFALPQAVLFLPFRQLMYKSRASHSWLFPVHP